MDEKTERCPNCKRDILSGNYQMHAVHCHRNIELCSTCDEPVPRSQMEDHKMEFHSIFTCPECFRKFERSECDKHNEEECPKRIIPCKFCDLELKADEISDHEDYCGSRTEPCEGCGVLIMHKFRQMHLNSNHKFSRDDEDLSSESGDDNFIIDTEENFRNNYSFRFGRNSLAQNQLPSNSYLSHQAQTSRRNQNHRFSPYDLEEDFGNLDLEDMRRNRRSELHRATRNASTNQGSYPVEEETYIPCEFCSVPVPVDELFVHQTGCRPDLLSYKPSNSNEQNREQESVPVYDISDDDDDYERAEHSEVLIPCEFCNQQFSYHNIEEHQMSCQNNHLGNSNRQQQRIHNSSRQQRSLHDWDAI